MRHLIDPTVDCVFKAILGANGNEWLLVHFLNSLLTLEHPITSVSIENPYNDKQQLDAKLTVVDIMARDENKNVYQIELQLTSPKYLTSRMSFNLTQLHSRQLFHGEDFDQMRRTFTIWLCMRDVSFEYSEAGPNDYDFRFVSYDPNRRTLLNSDHELHVILLNRWQKPEQLSPIDEWIYFFTQAKNWSKLPSALQVKHMRRAMKVLEQFSEQKESYYEYLERFNIRANQVSQQAENESVRAENEAVKAELNQTAEALSKVTDELEHQKVDTARKLIALNNMPIEQIASISALTLAQVQKLIDESQS